jgi:hypothetical protein
MRVLAIAVLLLIAQESYAASIFGLESLMDSKEQVTPPLAISALVRKKEKKDLDDCQRDKHYTAKEMEEFFGAVTLNLNDDGKDDYLIYPKKYCFNMFGAHAIPYWVVMSSTKGYRLVKSGSTDAVKVLDSKTNGTSNIVDIYVSEETKYVFDGKKYKMAK